MDNIIIALIGVGGTLIGTLFGWLLNAQAYRIGRTTIYGKLESCTTLPPINLNEEEPQRQSLPHQEYFLKCVACNTRQIPIILESFSLKMQEGRNTKLTMLQLYELEDVCCTVANGVTISTQIAVQRQYIFPRTLHEFSVKIECSNPKIEHSRLTLVAFDERHKRHEFLIYDGWKMPLPSNCLKREQRKKS